MKSWKEWVIEESKKEYLKRVFVTIQQEKKKYRIYPKFEDTFRAFSLCPIDKTKVVILGQDAYPQSSVADGLAFSTRLPNYIPETLKVVFKEIRRSLYPKDNGTDLFETCNLEGWAKQGVLLINAALTVRENQPNSHKEIWKPFSLKVINELATLDRPFVWMLWGNEAKAFASILQPGIFGGMKLILKSCHPVAESRGSSIFGGNNIFKDCNEYLEKHYGKGQGIDWRTYKEEPFPKDWMNFKPITQ